MAKCIHCQTNIMIPARHRNRAQFCYICGRAFQSVNDVATGFESSLIDGSRTQVSDPPAKMPKRATFDFQTKLGSAVIFGGGIIIYGIANDWNSAQVLTGIAAAFAGVASWDYTKDAINTITEFLRQAPNVVEKAMPSVVRIETKHSDTNQITIDYAEQRVAQHLVAVAAKVVTPPLGKGLEFKRETIGQGSYNVVKPWLLENHWAVLRGANVRGGVVLTPRCYKMLEGMLRNSFDSPTLPRSNRL